jgi:hypothetical protein
MILNFIGLPPLKSITQEDKGVKQFSSLTHLAV